MAQNLNDEQLNDVAGGNIIDCAYLDDTKQDKLDELRNAYSEFKICPTGSYINRQKWELSQRIDHLLEELAEGNIEDQQKLLKMVEDEYYDN